jgi:hypothetical protein
LITTLTAKHYYDEEKSLSNPGRRALDGYRAVVTREPFWKEFGLPALGGGLVVPDEQKRWRQDALKRGVGVQYVI